MTKHEKKSITTAISECACVSHVTVCPASGMYDRMWAPLEPVCPWLKPNTSQRHETQTRGALAFLSMIGMLIASEEVKLRWLLVRGD